MKTEQEIQQMFNASLNKQLELKETLKNNPTFDSRLDLEVNGSFLLGIRKVLNYWSDKPFKN